MSDFYTLREQQSQGATDLLSTLRTVEISPSDICNRSCEFCPQSTDAFVPVKKFMTLDIVNRLAVQLENMNFDGRITFTGYGEPLLYKNLVESFLILKEKVPKVRWLEIVTNGDYLTQEKIKQLDKAGCTNITVSMYEGDISQDILKMATGTSIDFTFKHQYKGFDLVSRNDIMLNVDKAVKHKPCYVPFYKALIDVNGDVLLCAHDWTKTVVGNIKETTLKNIWLGDELNRYRTYLSTGSRHACGPCKNCDIDGTKHGAASFYQWISK